MKYVWVLVLLLTGVFTGAHAQTDSGSTRGGGYSIAGKLLSVAGEPQGFATITLLRSDSSVAGGDITKEDGTFTIPATTAGSYLVRAESIGMVTRYLPVVLSADSTKKQLGIITVSPSKTMLKTVNVVGEKPVVELKVDKKVFNVEKNTTAAGGSAVDVLQNVPSVSVDADGNVSMRGKGGVTILIDGKPATMLGADVNSALQSLPASSIESVEVIANPSAKYDAQGNTGIINIITKKDKRFGMNGNVTLGMGTRDKYNGNLGLNAHKGKWNAFFNTNVRLNRTFNNITTTRTDKLEDSSHYTYERAPRFFNGFFNTIGATYDANKYNSITLTQNVNAMQYGFSDNSNYLVYDNRNFEGPGIYRQQRDSKGIGGPVSSSTSIDYRKKFRKKDEELNIDATFAATAVRRNQEYLTSNDNNGVYYPNNPITQRAPGSGTNNSFTGWADYTNPLFTKNGKLGLGVKTQLFWFQSRNDPKIDSFGRPTAVDTTLLAIYSYNQQIHAAYVNWSDQLDKLSYQVGLRVEDAEYQGDYTSRGSARIVNNFLNLFPSAFVSYKLPRQQSVYVNYSKRTNRPTFFQLLPYLDVSNPSTVNTGNPALIPEFIDNVEISYNKIDKKGNNIILSTYYQYTSNLTERITRPATGDFVGRLLVMPENIASGRTYGVEAIANLKLTRIWDATVNVNGFRNELTIGNNSNFGQFFSNSSGLGWFGKFNSNVKLLKNFSLQFNGNYESRKVTAQGSARDSYWLDIALRKTMLKGKATIVANCSDVFKTRRFINYYDLSVYTQTIDRVKETRIGNLTFTYRFGTSESGKNVATDLGGGKGMKGKGKIEPPRSEDRDKNLKEGDDEPGTSSGGGGQKK